MVDAHRAHQFAVDENAEPIAIGRVVQVVGDHLIVGFFDEAVQPVCLVAKAVYRLEILAAFAASVFGTLEQLFDFAGEGRRSRRRAFLVFARHRAKRRQLRNHTRNPVSAANEGTAIANYVNF